MSLIAPFGKNKTKYLAKTAWEEFGGYSEVLLHFLASQIPLDKSLNITTKLSQLSHCSIPLPFFQCEFSVS